MALGIINIQFPVTEKEHEELIKMKGKESWRAFIMPKLGMAVEKA